MIRFNFPDEPSFQRWIRIKLSLAAYAYEFKNVSIMSDSEFDTLSLHVNKNIDTGHGVLDWFFLTEFQPFTGMWIRKHPELDKIEKLYIRLSPAAITHGA